LPATDPVSTAQRSGRSARGAPCVALWRKSTFIAGLRSDRIDGPMLIEGAMDGDAFCAWVEQVLTPTLAAGDILISDNLNVMTVGSAPERPLLWVSKSLAKLALALCDVGHMISPTRRVAALREVVTKFRSCSIAGAAPGTTVSSDAGSGPLHPQHLRQE